jgi:hypothetical protein
MIQPLIPLAGTDFPISISVIIESSSLQIYSESTVTLGSSPHFGITIQIDQNHSLLIPPYPNLDKTH